MTEKPMPHSLLIASALAMFTAAASGTTRAPFLLDMARDLSTTLALVGNLVATTSVSWAVAGLLAGAGSDRWGRRPFLILGPAALCLAMIGVSTAQDLPGALLWSVVSGGCSGMFTGVVFAEVSAQVDADKQGRALAWVMSGQSLTLLVGVPLAAFIGSSIGWRGVNQCVAVLAGVSALAMLATTRPVRIVAKQQRTPNASLAAALSARVIRLLGMGIMERICYGMTAVYFATFLQTTYRLTLGGVAAPLAVFASGNILGTILGGQLADKLSNRRRTYAVAMLGSGATALALFGWQSSVVVSVCLGFVYVFLNAIARPAMLASLAEVPEHTRGTVMGLNVTCASLGWIGASGLGGMMIATQGFAGFGPVTAAVAALGAALALFRL